MLIYKYIFKCPNVATLPQFTRKLGLLSVVFFLFPFLFTSCDTFFGKRTNLDFIQQPEYSIREVSYVPIQPVISGFNQLTDVLTGFDKLIYVVDKGANAVIAYDEAFVELGRKNIAGATKIMQNRRLDLYVIGYTDTTINTVSYRLSTIYKLETIQNNGYGLANAAISRKLIYPFACGRNSLKSSDTIVKFTDITPLADGSYYVTRRGNTSNDVLTGPDDAVLYFSSNDTNVGFLQVVTSNGTEEKFFKSPLAITSYVQPPQSDRVVADIGFAYLSGNFADPQKSKVISGVLTEQGPVFAVEDLNAAAADKEKADGGLYEFNQFIEPSDIAFSGDGTQLFFVTDAAKDSVYVFTRTGLEGVNPPAGSATKKNIKVSFGGRGEGLLQFNRPTAVAYSKKILIVADQGNRRILRFKLTTDFE
ncbi:MAG: hypothetical protein ACKVOU_06300 [Cytophagales bacterium]